MSDDGSSNNNDKKLITAWTPYPGEEDSSASASTPHRPWPYQPTVAPAALFVFIFLYLAVLHTRKMLRTRLWFCLPLMLATYFETVGLVAGVVGAFYVYNPAPYIVHLTLTQMAPTMTSATINMLLCHIMNMLDAPRYPPAPSAVVEIGRPRLVPTLHLSASTPRTPPSHHPLHNIHRPGMSARLTKTFDLGHLFSMLVLCSGSALVGSSNGNRSINIMGNTMVCASLALQVLFLLVFDRVSRRYARRCDKDKDADAYAYLAAASHDDEEEVTGADGERGRGGAGRGGAEFDVNDCGGVDGGGVWWKMWTWRRVGWVKRTLWMAWVVAALLMVRSVYSIIEWGMGRDMYVMKQEWMGYVFDQTVMMTVWVIFWVWWPSEMEALYE